jgi:hypothetical protein
MTEKIIALTILGGISWGFMSHLLFHSGKSRRNPTDFFGSESWKRKYSRDIFENPRTAPDTWYYRIFNLKYKEAFPLSATLLVFLTDAIHLFQFIAFQSLFAAIALPMNNFWWVMLWLNLVWKSAFGFSYYGVAKEIR